MNGRVRRGLWPVAILALLASVAIPFATGTAVRATSSLFAPYQAIALGAQTDAVAIGDVTGDGRADVVATGLLGSADYPIYVLAGQPDGSLGTPRPYATAGSGSHRLQSVAIGDITGDGRADVVVGVWQSGVQVFPQLPNGDLGAPTLIETPDSLRVKVGQLDGAPGLDVAAIGWGTDTVSVLPNDGQGGLSAPVVYPARHGGYDDLEVGDVSGDGRDDIVVMSGQVYAIPNVSVLSQLPAGGFAPAAEYRVADQVNTAGIGIGDVTGDGRADVVASFGGNRPTSGIAVFAQTPAGPLGAPVSHPSYDIPSPVEIADLDRDGFLDVVTLHNGWLKAGVYLGLGGISLQFEDLYPLPSGSYDPHGLAVGDITGDGWPDLVIADSNNGVVVLRNNGPTLPPPSTSPSAPLPSSSVPPTPTPSPAPTPTPTPAPTPTPTPTPTPQLPTAPTGLLASPNLAAGIGLDWQPPVSSGTGPVTNYRIYRNAAGQAPAPLVTVGNVLTFVDTTVPAGATFSYSVAAVSAYGEGPRSVTVVAQRASTPGAPSGMAASAGKSGIEVTWTVPPTGGSAITGYRVYRGTTSGGETFLYGLPANALGFTDTTVTRKVRYFYKVSALNVIGEGPRSAEVNATAR